MVTAVDRQLMRRALCLAERGRGTTSPNPIVGAVVLSPDGVIVGQGAHRVAGGPHAEVIALDAAGDRARGATLYCTLEPCCHVGRTGPCAERAVAAGIARVVIALGDPNPRVSGGGVAFLRAHGVRVNEDVERAAAACQNAPFVTWTRLGRPLVTLKVAVSRDGFAGDAGRPVRLTGTPMDRRMHGQRAEVDAIAVGAGTVLIDDPRLNARLVYRQRPLVRVVFDRRGRITPGARLLQTLDAGPVIMMVSADAATSPNAAALRERGATVVAVEEVDPLPAALRWLAGREILSLLVEGGPALQRAFWDAGCVDRVQVIQTPTVLGTGVRAFVPAVASPAVRRRRYGVDEMTEWHVHRTD